MSIFDNVNTITINNKEVKSIVTSNGAVLYQKANDEYTGVMNDILTSYIVTCDSTLEPDFLEIVCVPVFLWEEVGFMNGHTVNDLNNTYIIPFDEFTDLLNEYVGEYGISVPTLWSGVQGGSEYLVDFFELINGLDMTVTNFENDYSENLHILYVFYFNDSNGEYMPLIVRYTATDSNNLQAFITNELIQYA